MATVRTGRFPTVASKKKWKKRAKEQERLADDMFLQAQQRGQELAAVDQFLHDLQLPGPSLNDWAMQMADALVKLASLRGITGNPFLGSRGQFHSVPSRSSVSNQSGEYTFLQPGDVKVPSEPSSSTQTKDSSQSPLPRVMRH